MSKTSERYGLIVAKIIAELSENFNIDQVEALNIAEKVIRKEIQKQNRG